MAEHDAGEGLGIAADLEELRRLEPPAQDPARRAAILRDVFARAEARVDARAFRRVGAGRIAVAVTAAGGMAAALAIAWMISEQPKVAPQSTAPAADAPALVLRAGRVEVGGTAVQGGGAIDARGAIEVGAEPAELALRDATVVRAARDTRVVYSGGGAERFRLERGELSLHVQPRTQAAPLVVETEELAAWVVGTRFTVSRAQRAAAFSTTVAVDEGLVRVVSKPGGETQLLAAGARVTLGAAAAQSAQATAIGASAVDADASRHAAAGAAREPAPARHAISTVIRQKLKAGAIGAARRLIERAQRERAASEVELAMLEAEADLAERRHERARSRYLAIVTRYPETSEAELSLFAAAQLSRGQAGIDLLQRYLARYPDGRFAKEAHRLLATLDAAKTAPPR